MQAPSIATRGETIHLPRSINLHLHHHANVEPIVGSHVPRTSEEAVHAPQNSLQERVAQQTTARVAELHNTVFQEAVVHVPRFVGHHGHHHGEVEQIFDAHVRQTMGRYCTRAQDGSSGAEHSADYQSIMCKASERGYRNRGSAALPRPGDET